MNNILPLLQDHTTDILADIETLVRIETPSNDAKSINRLQDVTQSWLGELGQVTRHPNQVGDVVQARVAGQSEARILLLAHVDTVYPNGAWNNIWSVKEVSRLWPRHL